MEKKAKCRVCGELQRVRATRRGKFPKTHNFKSELCPGFYEEVIVVDE